MTTKDYETATQQLKKYTICFQFVNQTGPFKGNGIILGSPLITPLKERYDLALSALENPHIKDAVQAGLILYANIYVDVIYNTMRLLKMLRSRPKYKPVIPGSQTIQINKK